MLVGPFVSVDGVALLPAPRGKQLGFYAAARRAFPQGRKLMLKRLRYVARAWRDRHVHAEWLRFLDARFSALDARMPQLYAKIQSTYVLRALDTAARVRLLQDHYGGFFSASRPLSEVVYSRSGLPLWSFDLTGTAIQLRLCHLPICWREGETSLALFDDARLICALTFVVTSLRECGAGDGGKSLVIGGIQGLHDAEGLNVFRTLTKSMHGLRPFSLLIHAIRAVALAFDAQRVLAVGDAQHALTHKRVNNKVRISYDEIWSDHGGAPVAGGMFDLGNMTPLKSSAEIPSNKRAQYRRRYQLMDELACAIESSIAAANR